MSISTVFFDLDGTLYPNENGMWNAIADRMEMYMYEFLHLPKEEIPSLRQEYFQMYGTTLRGLIENYSIDEYEYLEYVHDIPVENYLKPDLHLKMELEGISAQKWIFTNSDRAHSERVLNALDIREFFTGIIDVTLMNFINKPNPLVYQQALEISGNPMPSECIFVEDSPKNLVPAKNIGMKTILIGNKPSDSEADYHIHNIYSIYNMIEQINRSEINV